MASDRTEVDGDRDACGGVDRLDRDARRWVDRLDRTPPAGDAAFEARRQELINELENWQPVPGMDAAAASATNRASAAGAPSPAGRRAEPRRVIPAGAVRSVAVQHRCGRSDSGARAGAGTRRRDAPAGGRGTSRWNADTEDDDSSASDAADNPDPAVTLPNPLGETGLHTADGLPDGVQNLVPERPASSTTSMRWLGSVATRRPT